MTKLTFGLPDSLIDTVRQVVEAKKMDKVCPKCGKSPCQCESMKEEVDYLSEDWKETDVPKGDSHDSVPLSAQAHRDYGRSKEHANLHMHVWHKTSKTGKKSTVAYVPKTGSEALVKKGHISAHDAHHELFGHKPDEKMHEELKGNQKKIDANHNGKIDSQDFKILRARKEKMKEEVSFSDAELAHIESIMGEAKQYNVPTDKDMGPLNVAAQIRKGKEVGGHVEVKHPTTGKTHKIPVKVANKFNADYASAEKPAHKEKIEQDFVKQHMS